MKEEEGIRFQALAELQEIAETVMPFGRYAGKRLFELPAEYLQYFKQVGWPQGRLGVLMKIVYQMKADGSDVAFDPWRHPARKHRKADR